MRAKFECKTDRQSDSTTDRQTGMFQEPGVQVFLQHTTWGLSFSSVLIKEMFIQDRSESF